MRILCPQVFHSLHIFYAHAIMDACQRDTLEHLKLGGLKFQPKSAPE